MISLWNIKKLFFVLLIFLPIFCLFVIFSDHASATDDIVHAKIGGTAVLTCILPDPGLVISPSQHVIEWVRLGYDIPILIQFGIHDPRVHPNCDGELLKTANFSLTVLLNANLFGNWLSWACLRLQQLCSFVCCWTCWFLPLLIAEVPIIPLAAGIQRVSTGKGSLNGLKIPFLYPIIKKTTTRI